MKKLSTVTIMMTVLLCCTTVANAQFHLSIAPVTGMNFNILTGSDLKNGGSGFGLVLGGQAIMSFSPTFGLMSGLDFYDNRSASSTEVVNLGQTGNGTQVTGDQENSLSLAYFQFENLVIIRLPGSGFYFVGGPVVGFNIEATNEQTLTITTPNVTFQDGTTSQKSKASLKETLVRFELKVGAGYNIPISKSVSIFPQLTFGFGITKIISNLSARVMTVQLVTGVKFDLI